MKELESLDKSDSAPSQSTGGYMELKDLIRRYRKRIINITGLNILVGERLETR